MIEGQRISVSAKAAVVRGGSILLVRYDEPHRHYNLPGGRLLPGESLHGAVHRKLREECAATVVVRRLLYVYEHIPDPVAPEPGDYQKVQFNFLADLADDSPEPVNPPAAVDQAAVEWLPLARLPEIVLYPPITAKLLETLEAGGAPDALLRDPEAALT